MNSQNLTSGNRTISGAGELAHYQIHACLGEGGFGQVFEAWDRQLQRRVAIKQLKSLEGGSTNRLMREARMAASLAHAAFVRIYAFEDRGNSAAIVMELVPGQTVKQLLAGTRLPIAQALDLVHQVALAMVEAHQHGLVHGDLKPSNLMQEPGGRIRILDFGLAAQYDNQATGTLSSTHLQGTLAYMAPERFFGTRSTPQSDIYALGAILYECLTGQRPFHHLSGLGLAAALAQSAPQQWHYPATLAPALIQLICSMCARHSEQRIQSMQELAQQIAFVAATLGLIAPANHQTPMAPLMIAAAVPPAYEPGFMHSVTLQASHINNVNHTGQHSSHTGLHQATLTLANPYSSGIPFALPHFSSLQAWLAWRRGVLNAITTKFIWLGIGAGMMLLLWTLAQWTHYLSKPLQSAQPYSGAIEMQLGLGALRHFDRPDQINQATQHFTTILQHEPQHAAASAGLSLTYSFLYQHNGHDEIWLQKAAASAQQATRLNPQLALGHIANGWVWNQQGKSEQALAAYDQALRLEPSSFFAWYGKVGALRYLRQFQQAQQALEQASHYHAKERVFADELGTLALDQEDWSAAEQAFRQSIAMQPDSVYAYANLNAVLIRQNRMAEALQILQQGLQVRPSAWLYGNLGHTLFLQGDYLNAADAFEKAVAPENGHASDHLAWANLAECLGWLPNRVHQAHQAWLRAAQLLQPDLLRRPNDIALRVRMALYLVHAGDTKGAQNHLPDPNQNTGQPAHTHVQIAITQELLGNRMAALESIGRARSLGVNLSQIDAEPDLAALRHDPRYLPQ